MSEEFPRGRFVWYDLMTTDPDAAVAFYSALIGWGTTVWEEMQPPYTMWTLGETSFGGVARLPEEAQAQGARPHWLAYIATPDVDATAARAGELGGRVMVPPTDIPSVGRFAVLTDPQGAMFAGYTPVGEVGSHDGPSVLGECSWHELATTDHEAAFGFYEDLFGWQKTETMELPETGLYQIYRRANTDLPLGGMFNKPAEIPGPPSWTHYWRVEDVYAGAEKVKELGGQVEHGPIQIPDGDWVVLGRDPQGAAFAIHHIPPES